jgi:hypothetical protein
MKRTIKSTGTINTLLEKNAELASVFAVDKVGGYESSESVRLGVTKSFFHTFSIWLKNLSHKQAVSILLIVMIMNFFNLSFVIMNPGPHLVIGIGLDSDGVFASEVNSRGWLCA